MENIVELNLTDNQIDKLFEAWDYCEKNKLQFKLFTYMSEQANVTIQEAYSFVMVTTIQDRINHKQ